MKKLKITPSFINPFVDGTKVTLLAQCQIQALPLKPFVKTAKKKSFPQFAIAGIINIRSSKFDGSVAICFSERLFLKILENMFGEEFPEITEETQDAAAELANIIFGHAKKILNDSGEDLAKAFPKVLRGTQIQTELSKGAIPAIVVPFRIPKLGNQEDIFHLEIGIAS
ncbi:MAG: chemotaxis protein CheX [Bdellovibrionales bacterium]|nr:chemotaxis protein CheX [Bdellovibrionales bacterium]